MDKPFQVCNAAVNVNPKPIAFVCLSFFFSFDTETILMVFPPSYKNPANQRR